MDISLWEVCQIDAVPLNMELINRDFPFLCWETGITLEAVISIFGVRSDRVTLLCDPPFDDRSIW
ncbi:hypothetical protein AMTRI_Chr13g88760 [Amborella trichopoda]